MFCVRGKKGSAKLALPDRTRVTILSNECRGQCCSYGKGLLPLHSLNGKPNYHEKDISTFCSEASQQTRIPEAHVNGQWPECTQCTSSEGTQEVVREFGAPTQRNGALTPSRNKWLNAARGNSKGFPFFMPPKPGACHWVRPSKRPPKGSHEPHRAGRLVGLVKFEALLSRGPESEIQGWDHVP